MSGKPFCPAEGQHVDVGDREWIVGKRAPTGGFVIRPVDGDGPPRIAAVKEMKPWTGKAPPVDDGPPFSREEVEAALGRPVRMPPDWAREVIDELLGEWLAAWERQPAMLRGIELGANLAAAISSRWVLAADPARVAELVGDEDEDPRPLAIGVLTSVVLPLGLHQVQQQQPPT